MRVLLLTALIPPTGDSSKRLAAFVHFSYSEDFLSAGGIYSPI